MSHQADLDRYFTKTVDSVGHPPSDPGQRAELERLQERAGERLLAQHVLELGCGTGYCTEQLAGFVDSICATDNNPALLERARARQLDPDKVRFQQADALALDMSGNFTACFAGFFWSHVRREDQDGLLARLREVLGSNALVVLIDDNFLDDGEHPIARTDLEGNTFQILTTPDGEHIEVLKNYPTDSALRKRFTPFAREIRLDRTEHYWMLSCRLK